MSNFTRRILSGIVMATIAAVTLIWADGIPFRIFYGFVATVAMAELITNAVRARALRQPAVILEGLAVIAGAIAIMLLDHKMIAAAIIIAIVNDTGAYAIGKSLHGQFSHTKPFPKTSPTKSWEGLYGGALFGALGAMLCRHLNLLQGGASYLDVVTFTGWIFAVFGDWLESKAKRAMDIKDSGDIFARTPVLCIAEKLTDGHGGYLDRIDSIGAVALYLVLLQLILH